MNTKYIRADDMAPKFAKYYKHDSAEIIKQIYLSVLKLKSVDSIGGVALEYSEMPLKLSWSGPERFITLGRMPYNAKHLITLQNFLLWMAKKKDVK